MTELQHCLPEHARLFFIRLRNLKWEETRRAYNASRIALASEAAAMGMFNSGHQIKNQWELSRQFIGDLAFGYLEAGLETCALYELRLDKRLCDGFESSIKDFLVAQQQHAINNAAKKVPGALPIQAVLLPGSNIAELHDSTRIRRHQAGGLARVLIVLRPKTARMPFRSIPSQDPPVSSPPKPPHPQRYLPAHSPAAAEPP